MLQVESHGYNETLSATSWGQLAQFLGNHPVVLGANDFRVGIGTGDRSFQVTPGIAYGDGIIDILTTTYVDACPALTTPGTSRWDTIYLSRDYANKVTSLGVIAGTASANPVQMPSLPAATDTLKHSWIAMAQVTYGKAQLTGITDLRMVASRPLMGPTLGVRDKYEGLRVIDPGTLVETLYRGGQPTRLYSAPAYWGGTSTTWASGFTLGSGLYVIPAWSSSARHGTATFAPTTNGMKLRLPAGWYEISAWLQASDMSSVQWDLRLNCTNIIASVQNANTQNPGGTSLGQIPNGGSKTVRIGSDSDLTTLIQSYTGATLWGAGNYLDITRISDL